MKAYELLDCCVAGMKYDETGRGTSDDVLYALRYQAIAGMAASIVQDLQEGDSLNAIYCLARHMEADLYYYNTQEVDSGECENEFIVLSSDELMAATQVLAMNGWDQDDIFEGVSSYVELLSEYVEGRCMSL